MKYIAYIIAVVTMLNPLLGAAQDGEGLFKSKCNVCHLVDANSTGPNLKGVKAKWEEAGEGEMLYEWVKDPKALIALGKSEMAKKIKNFSASDMTPQPVTNEEIDAIFSYVDNYVKPIEVVNTPTGDPVEVNYVPNYHENLTLFYALLTMAIFLLFAIILMSGTVTRFIKSDYFKNHAKDAGNNPLLKTILLIVGFTLLFTNNSHALKFMQPGEALEGMPWLIVENIDIYVLVFVNIVLISVLFYIKRMMKVFTSMTKPEEEELIAHASGESLRKVNQILTSVVPIEEEHTILLHHEYDGIKELDNNLPPWWVWLFYATIAFGVVYIFHYHILKTGDLQEVELAKATKKHEMEIDAFRKSNAMNVTEENATLMTESSDLSAGKAIFSANCVVCHSENGEGNIGPNLTDKNWIYGYEIGIVFGTITHGTPNGMSEHGSKLNPIQIQQVSSYVLSLPETKGLEPNGDIIEK